MPYYCIEYNLISLKNKLKDLRTNFYDWKF